VVLHLQAGGQGTKGVHVEEVGVHAPLVGAGEVTGEKTEGNGLARMVVEQLREGREMGLETLATIDALLETITTHLVYV